MSRAVKEWIGKTDDTAIPPRVKLRIFEKYDGKCYATQRKLSAGEYDFDHITALCNGGENRESNIGPIYRPAHREKTSKDVAMKSKDRRVKMKHIGLVAKKPKPMMNGREIKRKLNDQVVYVDTGEPV